MADNFVEIMSLLSCPDDGERLHYSPCGLLCSCCGRRFRVYESNLAEILPSGPRELPDSVSQEYRDAYAETFRPTYHNDAASFAWGAEESVSESWRRKRRREVNFVKPLITEGEAPSDAVLCDISAGAGYYTLAYAHLFRHVLHCDLSISNLSYVWRKAREMGIRNIFFIRADYLALPFFHSLDRVLCLDTLIRGEAHETLLLAGVGRALKPTGVAVVDFHNWWHNPLRRIGFLPENFCHNRSYRRSEAERLLCKAGIRKFGFHPFVQEFDSGDGVGGHLSELLPPTRLVYRITSSREPSLPLAGTWAKGAHP